MASCSNNVSLGSAGASTVACFKLDLNLLRKKFSFKTIEFTIPVIDQTLPDFLKKFSDLKFLYLITFYL